MWTSPTRLTRFQSGKRNAKGNLLAQEDKNMMRPMTYIEELENALVELLGAICETDDDAELASLTRQYEYCEAELVFMAVA